MTPRFLAQQKKIRLLVGFLFVVLLFLAFQLLQSCTMKSNATSANLPAKVNLLNDSHFMGLRHATAREIQAELPEITGKPTVIEFSSKMCHDCQRLKPVVAKLLSSFPGTHFKGIDVIEDQPKKPGLFRIFKPVTVPILVMIGPDGEIKNVLYNYQSPDAVKTALNQLQTGPAVKTASKAAGPTR